MFVFPLRNGAEFLSSAPRRMFKKSFDRSGKTNIDTLPGAA